MDRNSNEMRLVAYNFEPGYSEEKGSSQQHSIAEASSASVCPHVYRSQCNICQDFDFRKNKLFVQLKELLKLIITTHIFYR